MLVEEVGSEVGEGALKVPEGRLKVGEGRLEVEEDGPETVDLSIETFASTWVIFVITLEIWCGEVLMMICPL